jgi:hypothetical protein
MKKLLEEDGVMIAFFLFGAVVATALIYSNYKTSIKMIEAGYVERYDVQKNKTEWVKP